MTDTPNGRVTLAVLQRDILHLTDEVRQMSEAILREHRDHETRVRVLEEVSHRASQWRNEHHSEHEELRGKTRVGDWIAYVAAAAAAAAGVFVDK